MHIEQTHRASLDAGLHRELVASALPFSNRISIPLNGGSLVSENPQHEPQHKPVDEETSLRISSGHGHRRLLVVRRQIDVLYVMALVIVCIAGIYIGFV